jgi:hypothetical protein
MAKVYYYGTGPAPWDTAGGLSTSLVPQEVPTPGPQPLPVNYPTFIRRGTVKDIPDIVISDTDSSDKKNGVLPWIIGAGAILPFVL